MNRFSTVANTTSGYHAVRRYLGRLDRAAFTMPQINRARTPISISNC